VPPAGYTDEKPRRGIQPKESNQMYIGIGTAIVIIILLIILL
jgi:hypothetical protein